MILICEEFGGQKKYEKKKYQDNDILPKNASLFLFDRCFRLDDIIYSVGNCKAYLWSFILLTLWPLRCGVDGISNCELQIRRGLQYEGELFFKKIGLDRGIERISGACGALAVDGFAVVRVV